jgi:Flp pilus assembly protein TadB
MVETRIARLERLQSPVSWIGGIALGGGYFLWQLAHHWIATYTWMVPFAFGFAAPRLWFAYAIEKVHREARELPAARVVAHALPAPAPAPVATVAPTVSAPTPIEAGPQHLK